MTRARSWSASITNLLNHKKSSSTLSGPRRDDATVRRDTFATISNAHVAGPTGAAAPPRPRVIPSRPTSRPLSMMQPYKPPRVEVEAETLPELHHIFNFMNNHGQRLYTEGYFLKLTDLNHDGNPGLDREWKECFGQLRGTVLSLWDAVALDNADGEDVVPTFLNLTDASIKMIDQLPTRAPGVPPLTNVLSISTAGRNRYLFHFNSHHSLAQWTASIRLSMFEQSKLQEIYTGALIAAKGRELNAIQQITERTRFKYEEWVRVRFGAGTPWKKCWCVITQPDEKAIKKAKTAAKKANKSAYEQRQVFKGDIKFYNDKKTKKQQPIATMTDAFAAYALYPSSKQLVDVSTLVKLEGRVKIHGDQLTENEGFVFVMPDIHPAVSGFETMLRFLFPTFDTFALYGRPGMLIPDKTDPRSMMFAMPREGSHDCGYLDVTDVVNVIVTQGSHIRLESEWRDKLKSVTHAKIRALLEGNLRPRTSLPAGAKLAGAGFQNGFGSTTSLTQLDLPPQGSPARTPQLHSRSASDTLGYQPSRGNSRIHRPSFDRNPENQHLYANPPLTGSSYASSEESGLFQGPIDPAARRLQQQTNQPDPEPVPMTPVATHAPSSRPSQPLPQPRGRDSMEDNIFAGIVPQRNGSAGNHPPLPPTHGQMPANIPPAPPNHGQQYTGQQSQITQQSAMGYENTIEPPPGFALQNSRVLVRGPPPTNDQKSAYDDEYADHPPPGRPISGMSSQSYTGPPADPYPHRQSVHMDYREQVAKPAPQTLIRMNTANRPPPLDTKIVRKPVQPSAASQKTPDSYSDLASHLIDERALDRIGPKRSPSQRSDAYFQPDEDTLDRRAIQRIQRVLEGANSDSEYGEPEEEEEPDYASTIDTDEPPPVKRNADLPRAGQMKVVGQQAEPEVVVGDAHYRPGSSSKALEELVDVPKVDFGTTINHGRSLSTELFKGGQNHGSKQYEAGADSTPSQGSNSNARRVSSNGDLLNPGQRAPSRSSGTDEERRRESFRRPSPESQESDSDNSKRRSMAWQPGMANIGSKSPDPTSSAERYVSEKAAAAQNQTRSRYRRTSTQMNQTAPTTRNTSTEYLPTCPSRVGNSAFMPSGLVSAPDLSAHLSAREQEYVARQTGSTLLRMDASKTKPPPHKAGLIGAIHSREQEKQQMKDAWQRGKLAPGGLTVQQEIARRQQQHIQQDQAMKRRTTPSPRPLSQAFDQQSYFPQQPMVSQQQQFQQQQQQFQQQQQQQQKQQQQQQFQQQQQQFQQQQQQMMYGQQQALGNYGYVSQTPANRQSYQGNTGNQGSYYGRN